MCSSKPGCQWPKDYKTFQLKGWIQLTLKIDTLKLAVSAEEAESQLIRYIRDVLLTPCDIHRVDLTVTPKESLITREHDIDDSHSLDES